MKRSASPRASTPTRGRSRGPRSSPCAESRPASSGQTSPRSGLSIRHSSASSVPAVPRALTSVDPERSVKRVDPQGVGRIGAARAQCDRAVAQSPVDGELVQRDGQVFTFDRGVGAHTRPDSPGPFVQQHAGIEIGSGQRRSQPKGSAPSARSCGRRAVRATLRRRSVRA